MGYFLKSSSTAKPLLFLMIDATDHVSPKTGLTPTVTLSKNGATFASPAGEVTELANGWYKVAGNATDSGTVGPLLLHAMATGADPTDEVFIVVAFDPDAATNLGLSALPATAAGASGGLPLGVDSSGRVDVLKINGTVQTARDLGASVLISSGTGTGQLSVTAGVIAASGNWYTGGNITGNLSGSVGSVTGNVGGNVVGSVGSVTGAVGSVTAGVSLAASQHVIVDSGTITTYTGNTPQTGDAYAQLNTLVPHAIPFSQLGGSGTYYVQTDTMGVDSAAWHSATSGRIGANLSTMFDVATQNFTGASVVQSGDSYGVKVVHAGTARNSSTTTLTLDTAASSTNGFYVGSLLLLVPGGGISGVGLVGTIIGYVGSTRVATISTTWATIPSTNVLFVVLAAASVDVATIMTRPVADPGSGNSVYFAIAAYGGKGGVPITDAATGLILSGYGGGEVSVSASVSLGSNAPSGWLNNAAFGGDVLLNTNLQTIKTQSVTCAGSVTILASVGTAATSTAQTGDSYARLGAPAGASVSADVAAVKTSVGSPQQVGTKYATGTADSVTAGVTVTTNNDKTGYGLAASQHVIVDSGTVTNLTNLPTAPTDWLSAAAVTADAVTKIQAGLSTYAGADTSGTATLVGLLTSARAGYLDNLNISGNVAQDSTVAKAATALTNATWTDARAGYLDNLNVGGAVASQADVSAINQSASKHLLIQTVGQYEKPTSGSTTYTVEVRTFAADTGAAVNADSTPTLAATGQTSGDLSANLGSAANSATGVYRWTYSVASSAVDEPIRFDVSATIGGSTFTLSAYTQVVDLVSAVWTSSDETHLTAIYNALPAYTPSVDASGRVAADTVQWNSGSLPTVGTSTLTTSDVQSAMTSQGYTSARAGYLDVLNGIVAAIWGYATRVLTAFGFKAAATVDWSADVSNKPTAFASNNLPGDYQQRGQPVTLPSSAPSGYGGSTDASTFTNAFSADVLVNAPAGATPAEIWANATRTLTGSAAAVGPTAATNQADICYICPAGGTRGLYAQVIDWSGSPIVQAGVRAIGMTIYATDDRDGQRHPLTNFTDVPIDAASVIFDTIQSDAWASDYNFRHIPDISAYPAFARPGRTYLVVYTITPPSGQPILVRFRVKAT